MTDKCTEQSETLKNVKQVSLETHTEEHHRAA